MDGVSHEVLEQAVELLGNPGLSHDEVEEKLLLTQVKDLVARRLCSFVPEAFGVVAAGHLPKKVIFPSTFSALDKSGQLMEFPFASEPIFEQAKQKAEAMFAEGPREIFEAIAARSSVTEVLSEAVDSGTDYEGAELAIETEVPAEVYHRPPFWRWVLGQLFMMKAK